jgi:hypothetical protein
MKLMFPDSLCKAEPDILRLLVNSLCPTIFGHEMVKAGLLLALFGGCQKFAAFIQIFPAFLKLHVPGLRLMPAAFRFAATRTC